MKIGSLTYFTLIGQNYLRTAAYVIFMKTRIILNNSNVKLLLSVKLTYRIEYFCVGAFNRSLYKLI